MIEDSLGQQIITTILYYMQLHGLNQRHKHLRQSNTSKPVVDKGWYDIKYPCKFSRGLMTQHQDQITDLLTRPCMLKLNLLIYLQGPGLTRMYFHYFQVDTGREKVYACQPKGPIYPIEFGRIFDSLYYLHSESGWIKLLSALLLRRHSLLVQFSYKISPVMGPKLL